VENVQSTGDEIMRACMVVREQTSMGKRGAFPPARKWRRSGRISQGSPVPNSSASAGRQLGASVSCQQSLVKLLAVRL